MNKTPDKINQQVIFEELKVEGDLTPKKPTHGTCCTCSDCGYTYDECICIDFTEEAGAFWLLKRLPEWERFEEFIGWCMYRKVLKDTSFDISGIMPITIRATSLTLTWLATDVKDGKAPALYNALCEFMGLEVKE